MTLRSLTFPVVVLTHCLLDSIERVLMNCIAQVMDTPGLLHRPIVQLNAMELLTLATVQHIPSAIIFVTDCTGSAGPKSSLEDQIQVRQLVKQTAEARPQWDPSMWLDVISKVDLSPVDGHAENHLNEQADLGAIPMSCKQGEEIGTDRVAEWIKTVVGQSSVLREGDDDNSKLNQIVES